MITYLLRKLVILWYKLYPKYYFSLPEKTDANIYWVNIEQENWGRVEYKDILKKKYKWFGKEIKKKIAVYDVNSLLFYSISDKHAQSKALKKIKQFKYLFDGSNSSNNR